MFHPSLNLFVLTLLLSVTSAAFAQPTTTQLTWEDVLYAPKVNYSEFACRAEVAESVAVFFNSNPLSRQLSVCHNNCAVLKNRPESKVPRFIPKIRGNGSIAVHFLVGTDGVPIYARALNGHSLMRSVLQSVWCGARFGPAGSFRQTIVFICPDERCDGIQAVQLKLL